MSPATIAHILAQKKITLAALTDHNTALNSPGFAAACKKENIVLLYGMEAQTSEEIHVLCLFPRMETSLEFCNAWYDSLPNIPNKPEVTGDQVIVDENDEITGVLDKYLIVSAPYSLDECARMVHDNGGLVIPAHVDRPAFSMISQLGQIVKGDWDALEFVRPQILEETKERLVQTNKDGLNARQIAESLPVILPAPYPVTTSSDAHYIEHIGRRAFDLDLGNDSLTDSDGLVSLLTVRAAFAKRVVHP